jgi:SAM-dependent methyltransferase
LDGLRSRKEASPHITHIIGDATKLPIKSNCIDCVKCTELLEHVEYPEKVLKEISRVVKPQGFLVLSVPFLIEIHGDPYDFYRFTDQKIKQELEKEFDILVLKRQGFYFTVLAYILQRGIDKSTSRISRLLRVLFPLLDMMVKLDDRPFVKESGFLTSFTTGVLAIAQKKSSPRVKESENKS